MVSNDLPRLRMHYLMCNICCLEKEKRGKTKRFFLLTNRIHVVTGAREARRQVGGN